MVRKWPSSLGLSVPGLPSTYVSVPETPLVVRTPVLLS